MEYGFAHKGKVYTPSGRADIPAAELAEYNAELERKELEWLKTAPERVFLYVRLVGADVSMQHGRVLGDYPWLSGRGIVHTWNGYELDTHARIGPRREFPAFGPFPSRRRAVSCRIFGTLYHGWYMESSGDYCRLKRAKRQ